MFARSGALPDRLHGNVVDKFGLATVFAVVWIVCYVASASGDPSATSKLLVEGIARGRPVLSERWHQDPESRCGQRQAEFRGCQQS